MNWLGIAFLKICDLKTLKSAFSNCRQWEFFKKTRNLEAKRLIAFFQIAHFKIAIFKSHFLIANPNGL
jgi:hypothetical protein